MHSPYVVVNNRILNPGQAGLLRHAATESAESTAESALAGLLLALLTTLLLNLVIFLFLVIGKE